MKKKIMTAIMATIMVTGVFCNTIDTENSYRSNNRGKMYAFQFLLY